MNASVIRMCYMIVILFIHKTVAMARTKNSHKRPSFDVRDHDNKRSKLDIELAELYVSFLLINPISSPIFFQKTLATSTNRRAVEDEINEKVRNFNKSNPKHLNYYDLHGMTKTGAIIYVAEIVERSRGSAAIIRLETGKGLHSVNRVPVIKNYLLAFYSSMERCSILPDEKNPGILRLKVW